MPKLLVLTRGRPIAVGVLALLLTTGAAPGPGASQAELMVYSVSSAAALVGAVWIVIRLRKIIAETILVLAVLLALYLLVKIVVEAIIGI